MLDHMSIWTLLFRVVTLYVMVFITLRIMEKRKMGKLSIFDFVVSVMIAELSVLPMEDAKIPLSRPLLALTGLVVLQLILATFSLHSHRFRYWVEDEPSVLIEHGQIKDKQMKKNRYTMYDLLIQLREQGIARVQDVEFAILETSRKLSIIPKAESRPITTKDMGKHVESTNLPMPLIIDGYPVSKTLQILKKDLNWLQNELYQRGYGWITDIFYATIDLNGTLQIDAKDKEEKNRT